MGNKRTGGVTLVGIGLEYDAAIHSRGVRLVVLGGVVRVHRVGHVHGNDQRPSHARQQGSSSR